MNELMNVVREKFHLDLLIYCNLITGDIVRIGEYDSLEYRSLVDILVYDLNCLRNLNEHIQGMTLPQSWGQGEANGIVCKPREDTIMVVFHNIPMEAVDLYHYAKSIDEYINVLFDNGEYA